MFEYVEGCYRHERAVGFGEMDVYRRILDVLWVTVLPELGHLAVIH